MQLQEVPLPPLTHGQILVRTAYTTLCRSDLNTYSGKRNEPVPTILGHEIVGTVKSMAPGAPSADLRGDALAEGDRITWAIYAADPDSALARAGIPQKAPDLFKYGHERITEGNHLHGGLADYCILRNHTPVVRIAREIPLPVAALINCAGATAAGALRLAGSVAGKSVLITGSGMLGVFACAMAAKRGAQRVIAADIDPQRLAVARHFGAAETLPLSVGEPIPETAQADVHLDFSGDPETVEQTLRCLPVGAVSVLVGATFPQRDLAVNAERVVRQLLTIRGLHNYNSEDLVAAVSFLEQHHQSFPFTALVADRFSLEQVNDAFEYALAFNVYRVGIRFEAEGAGTNQKETH
jgi:putative phosphonate catabolism associated alcohol dehydrogenase